MSKIEIFSNQLKEYGYIETIDFSRETGVDCSGKYDILLVLTKQINTPESQRVKITFWNCADIKIGEINGFLSPTIIITDITDRQLEKLNYKINESENEMFSFLCSDFDVESI